MFVTIDPGTDTGWSIWSGLELEACGVGDPRRHPKHVVGNINDAYVEDQRIHRGTRRPNDIITLAHDAARWATLYEVLAVDVHWVEPRKWKGGSVPKDISHARIWQRLGAREQTVVHEAGRGMAPSKRHNMLDAIGIGLWAAKRAR